MIPAGILYGQLKINGRNPLEIRAIELAGDYLTFRLPVGLVKNISDILEICWYFFDWRDKKYHEVCLRQCEFAVEAVEDRQEDPEYIPGEFCRVYRMRSEVVDFVSQCSRLSLEYLRIVDMKLNLEPDELIHELTGMRGTSDVSFCGHKGLADLDLSELHSVVSKCGLGLELSVETPGQLAMLRDLGVGRYIENYLRDASLSSSVNGLVLGNQFCYELIPEEAVLEEAIRTATEYFKGREDARVSLALPPIPEFKYEKVCSMLERLVNMELPVRFIVNDLGVLERLSNCGVVASEGVLMAKASRDPRKKYTESASTNLCVTGDEAYWPFFQTNTGTFCPLYAMVENGDRGHQVRVIDCSGLCEGMHLKYSEDEGLKWKYNSVFGISSSVKDIEELVKGPDGGKVTRVILNL